MSLKFMAKQAAYQSRMSRGRATKKPGPRDILGSLFSPKFEPCPPGDVPTLKRPESATFGSGEGRGMSGQDELKVLSADRAFLEGLVDSFLEKDAFAPYNLAYNVAQRLQPPAWRDQFADAGALARQYPDQQLRPKRTMMGHLMGGVPLAKGVLEAGQKTLGALTGAEHPRYQGMGGPR